MAPDSLDEDLPPVAVAVGADGEPVVVVAGTSLTTDEAVQFARKIFSCAAEATDWPVAGNA